MDVESGDSVRLGPHEGFTVPKNVRHRPRSPQRSVVLMVKRSVSFPTGD
ncbi:MAG TPA: hypothetical protein VMT95_05130 [Candidatus Binatia bacterium]|nr:hypothetical protein [Candidatus Binatia bacterium]